MIKHGALGDMILATGPMKSIRQRHPDAHIVLLTGKAFVALMKDCPFVDEILVDAKPKPWKLADMRELAGQLRKYRYSWVYDLQTSSRSTWYYHLFPSPKPNISSLHSCASHRHSTPERTKLHTIDRQKQQLQIAGFTEIAAPDISWLKGKHAIAVDKPYALLIPGGSAHRPEKRWPGKRYAELAVWLGKQAITPVLIGAGAEEGLLSEIEADAKTQGQQLHNLCNSTSYGDIAELARGATLALGNDTGPMHIIAAAGCPSLVLFNSHESNPELCAPRTEKTAILNVGSLTALPLDAVTEELKRLHLLDLS